MIKRIKEKCILKGITIAKLEKNLNYGNGTIRKWGKNSPSIEKIIEVAEVLEVSIEWLITGKDPDDLTPEERELIEHYRSMNETGKRMLLNDAREIAPAMKAGVSISRAGKTGTENN